MDELTIIALLFPLLLTVSLFTVAPGDSVIMVVTVKLPFAVAVGITMLDVAVFILDVAILALDEFNAVCVKVTDIASYV